MENIKKQNITLALRDYCGRHDSQNRAARSLTNVSAATLSQMLNGKWELITDEMWRNVAAQIGYREEKWEAVETTGYRRLMFLLGDIKPPSIAALTCSAATSTGTASCSSPNSSAPWGATARGSPSAR